MDCKYVVNILLIVIRPSKKRDKFFAPARFLFGCRLIFYYLLIEKNIILNSFNIVYASCFCLSQFN